MYAGSFSEVVVVTEECAVKVSKDLPFEVACLIGCGVMTGVGAVLNIAELEPGGTAAIIGCGAVGLSAIQGAKLAKAGKILAIDRDPVKLETAKQFGATDILLADENVIQACFSGELLLNEYITNRIGLADVNEGLARLKQGKEIRSVILLN